MGSLENQPYGNSGWRQASEVANYFFSSEPILSNPNVLIYFRKPTKYVVFLCFAECPPAADGFDRFACPSPDKIGRYKCIDAHALCDGYIDCPESQDEDRMACMFFKTVSFTLLFEFSMEKS